VEDPVEVRQDQGTQDTKRMEGTILMTRGMVGHPLARTADQIRESAKRCEKKVLKESGANKKKDMIHKD